MRQVDRRVPPESRLYIYPAGFDATPVFFYRGASQAMEEDPEELVKRLRSRRDFIIMSEREWREIQRSHGWLPAPILKSASTGPDGDAPLVLLHSGSGGANP
jgi:hypothetical protein